MHPHLSYNICVDKLDFVVCCPVCKCINDPNAVCMVFPGCLDQMVYGNADDRLCDHGRFLTFDLDLATVSVCSQS